MIDGISLGIIIYLSFLFSKKYPWTKRIFLSIFTSILIAILGSFISAVLASIIMNTENFFYPGAVYAMTTTALVKSFYLSVVGLIALFFYRKKYINYHSKRTVNSVLNVPIDSDWETAMIEINEGHPNKALWARALAASNGDRQKTEAEYLNLRSRQLSNERESRVQHPSPHISMELGNEEKATKKARINFFLQPNEIAILVVVAVIYIFYLFIH